MKQHKNVQHRSKCAEHFFMLFNGRSSLDYCQIGKELLLDNIGKLNLI